MIDALHADCKRWPGTQESLSRDVCGSAQALRHKLSGYKGSVLSVHDALTVMQLTGGRETIQAMARELGGVYIQLPQMDAIVDNTDLLSAGRDITVAMGDFFAAEQTALADERLDVGEQKILQRKVHKVTQRLVRYLALVVRVFGVPQEADHESENGFSDAATEICSRTDSTVAPCTPKAGRAAATGAVEDVSGQGV